MVHVYVIYIFHIGVDYEVFICIGGFLVGIALVESGV